MFLIEDEDGEIFGYYESSNIYKRYGRTEEESFHFNLHSVNNRLEQPMKFEVYYWISTGVMMFSKSETQRIIARLGDIWLSNTKAKDSSWCYESEDFEYHHISSALCGKWRFTPKRILAIQMK